MTVLFGSTTISPVKETLEQTINTLKIVKTANKEISKKECIKAELEREGYTFHQELGKGEGKHRSAFRATYTSGEVKQSRIPKIIHDQPPIDSICARAVSERGLEDENAIHFANIIQHPNAINILEHKKILGTNVIIEEDYNGTSMKTIIDIAPLKNKEDIRNVAMQKINFAYYLNIEGVKVGEKKGFFLNESFDIIKKVLYRDWKPENWLINKSKSKYSKQKKLFIKATDFEHCAFIEDIKKKHLPTKGGSKYTIPILLNAWVQDKEDKANKKSEAYGVAATILFDILGEDPFNYQLKESKNVSHATVRIKGETKGIELLVDDIPVKEITVPMHEKRLKTVLKKVPREFRKPLYRALTLKEKWTTYNMAQFKSDFEKSKLPTKIDILQAIYKSIKPALKVAAGVAVGTAVTVGMFTIKRNEENKEPTPATVAMEWGMNKFRFFSRNLSEEKISNELLLKRLPKTIDFYKAMLKEDASKGHKKYSDSKLDKTELAATQSKNVLNGNKRVVTAMLLSNYSHDSATIMNAYKNVRFYPSLVRKKFVAESDSKSLGRMDSTDQIAINAYGIMMMNAAMGQGEVSVEEVYARYYLSNEEKVRAQIKTKSVHYFPQTDNAGNCIEEGYRNAINPIKQSLIETALLYYKVEDEQGNININKFTAFADSLQSRTYQASNNYFNKNNPIKGLTDK